LSILNPQYAFLDVDFQNSNLTQVELNVENISEDVRKKSELARNTMLKWEIIPSVVYIKLNWITGWLLLIPVEIYCIPALMIAELLS